MRIDFIIESSQVRSQSATIQGMLCDMSTTFVQDFGAISDDKEEQKAEAEMLPTETTQEYDDTEPQKEADIEFFDQTKEVSSDQNQEWVLARSCAMVRSWPAMKHASVFTNTFIELPLSRRPPRSLSRA